MIDVHTTLGRARAAGRLGELNDELVSAHRELAELLVAEKESKLRGYADATRDGTLNETAKGKMVELQALPVTRDIFKLRAEIEAWSEERDHLRFLIDHDLI